MSYYHPYYNQGEYPTYNQYNNNRKKGNTIVVYGNGTIKLVPDIGEITLGVVTEDKDLEKAQRENAKLSNDIIDKLNELGIEDDDIETVTYTVEPVYDYVEGRQVFRGYRVTNLILVTIEDISKMGYIIDEVIKVGGNVVRNINFKVSNPEKYYKEALNLAVIDSINKAMGIGNTLGVLIEKVPKEIVEESPSYGPVLEPVRYGAPEGTTPIQPGKIEITSRVKSTFKY